MKAFIKLIRVETVHKGMTNKYEFCENKFNI